MSDRADKIRNFGERKVQQKKEARKKRHSMSLSDRKKKARKQAKQRKRVFCDMDAAWLNVHKICAFTMSAQTKDVKDLLERSPVKKRTFTDFATPHVKHECYRADDVLELMKTGVLGGSAKNAFVIVRAHSQEDLQNRPPDVVASLVNPWNNKLNYQQLKKHFQKAGHPLNTCSPEGKMNPEYPYSQMHRHLWALADPDDIWSGRAESVESCLPLEAAETGSGSVVWIRRIRNNNQDG